MSNVEIAKETNASDQIVAKTRAPGIAGHSVNNVEDTKETGASDKLVAKKRAPGIRNLQDAGLTEDEAEKVLVSERDKPFTKKPAETRQGSGKGNPEGGVAVVKPGRVMFEIAGVPEDLAREAIRLAAHKLPIKAKFVSREQSLEVQ